MSVGSISNDYPCGINRTIVLYSYYEYRGMRIRESRFLSRSSALQSAAKYEKIHVGLKQIEITYALYSWELIARVIRTIAVIYIAHATTKEHIMH